ncbi:MAG: histidine triad nucleotide-binding protein [Oscillospiraceae bacterium]|nr:histidine triad nucleotide-binding protein [Oscillospiraceae bacterium]
MDCLFCSIAKGEIPSTKVYEDDKIYAFNDIDPQAPVHVLIIPKEHIKWAYDINETNSSVVAHIFEAIPKIADSLGVKDGFRIVNNCGDNAGQTVKHLHYHLMAGREFTWPAG